MSGKRKTEIRTIQVDMDVTLKIKVPVDFNQDDIEDAVENMEMMFPIETRVDLVEVEIGEIAVRDCQ